jgi:hypothetical protein
MRWTDLNPEQGILDALDHAGERPPPTGSQNAKRDWSARFANACAVAIAAQFRTHSELRKKTVKPLSLASGTEPLTPLGAGVQKRIDVTVADAVLGLELGASLKGLNFVDAAANNYDKNLTGRLYELADELRVVHEHLPHAFMVGIFFLPLGSCNDKGSDRGPSSFANAVIKLRARTGRLDATMAAHAARCDAAFVALYSLGDTSFDRGLVRFLDVTTDPPKRGRPKVEMTFSLAEMVDRVVDAATHRSAVTWAAPESDAVATTAPDAELDLMSDAEAASTSLESTGPENGIATGPATESPE